MLSKKRTPKKSPSKVNSVQENVDLNKELLILGHLIKYNLYLLNKSIIFSSIFTATKDIDISVVKTHYVMEELDLDTKTKKGLI